MTNSAVPTTASTSTRRTFDVNKAFTPEMFMVSIRVNANKARRLKDAGIELTSLSNADMIEAIQTRADQAKQLGRDAFRLDRKDAAGYTQADTGRLAWEWSKGGALGICPANMSAELQENFGMQLANSWLTQKPGENMFTLKMLYLKAEPTTKLSTAAEAQIKEILAIVYEYGQIWRNPNGCMTLNLGGALVGEHRPVNVRELRFEPAGKFTSQDKRN